MQLYDSLLLLYKENSSSCWASIIMFRCCSYQHIQQSMMGFMEFTMVMVLKWKWKWK